MNLDQSLTACGCWDGCFGVDVEGGGVAFAVVDVDCAHGFGDGGGHDGQVVGVVGGLGRVGGYCWFCSEG